MKTVTIYTLDYCPYCKRAKSLLKDLNIPFEDIDITQNEDAQTKEIAKLYKIKGEVTFPQIIIDGKRIGGCSDLEHLIETNQLNEILNEE